MWKKYNFFLIFRDLGFSVHLTGIIKNVLFTQFVRVNYSIVSKRMLQFSITIQN